MITLDQIIQGAAKALKADYRVTGCPGIGGSPKVYVGLDTSNPPGEKDAPYIVVWLADTDQYDMGESAQTRQPSFEVDFALLNIATTTPNGTITHTGQTLVVQWGNRIRDCLQRTFGADHFANCVMNYGCQAPLWAGGCTVTLNYETGVDEPDVREDGRGYWGVYWGRVDAPILPATDLVATAVSATQIDLTWATSQSEDAYYQWVQTATDNNGVPGTWTNLTNLPATTRAYSHTGLTTATKHYYRIGAVGPTGFATYGPIANATTS